MTQDGAGAGGRCLVCSCPSRSSSQTSVIRTKVPGMDLSPPAPAPPFPVGFWGLRTGTLQMASPTLTVATSAAAAWKVEGRDLLPISHWAP